MSERSREERELAWADRTEDQPQDEDEKTYRDGSAIHECWNYKSAGGNSIPPAGSAEPVDTVPARGRAL